MACSMPGLPVACSNSCPTSWWCHPTISSSVIPLSSCLQSFPASESSDVSVLHIRWPKYWSISFSISPANEYSGLISFRMDWLEKTLESPLDCKEIQPVNPKGNQSWIFIGRTDVAVEMPILWLPDAKSWLIGKDPDVGKDWMQEEKGITEDELVGWHQWLNVHECEQALGIGDAMSQIRLNDWPELNW